MKKFFLIVCLLSVSVSFGFSQDFEDRVAARQPLFDAIESGDQRSVLRILSQRRHVNLNQRELWDGETFLIEAIRAKQPDIVRILLRFGADPDLREVTGVDAHDKLILGDTPLEAALEADSIEIVRLLIQHGVRLAKHRSALRSSKSIGMVRFLLDHGAPVNGRDDNGATYLHTAAARPELRDVARLLIERGASVNVADDAGATPLLRVESLEIARLLISKGAKVNAADIDGLTPLHLAAFEVGKIELAKLLVANGANVNARDNDGYTPLDFLVADSFDYAFALFLVAHGARVDDDLVREHNLVEEFRRIRTAVRR